MILYFGIKVRRKASTHQRELLTSSSVYPLAMSSFQLKSPSMKDVVLALMAFVGKEKRDVRDKANGRVVQNEYLQYRCPNPIALYRSSLFWARQDLTTRTPTLRGAMLKVWIPMLKKRLYVSYIWTHAKKPSTLVVLFCRILLLVRCLNTRMQCMLIFGLLC